jgi:hypothetical protein
VDEPGKLAQVRCVEDVEFGLLDPIRHPPC